MTFSAAAGISHPLTDRMLWKLKRLVERDEAFSFYPTSLFDGFNLEDHVAAGCLRPHLITFAVT
jgi:hypothetical protein